MSDWSIKSLSGSERKEIINQTNNMIAKDTGEFLPKKGQTQRYTADNGESGIVANNKDLIFIEKEDRILPSLKLAKNVEVTLPKIVVDTGAIKFVTNGADIMRPGIVHIDEDVIEGELVIITEENNNAPLAIGIALYDAIDMEEMEKGRTVSNLHYLSDDWWEFVP